MFRHHGLSRTHEHNLKIASTLSFVAGLVNVVGFISIGRLTTNVTGHFAFLVNDFLNFDFVDGLVLFLFVFAFFLGSFVANTIIEITSRQSDKNVFVVPIALEVLILVFLGFEGAWLMATSPNIIALLLLFAMGLQNSLVTKISNAVVRTTHLTGLFTDLGIEVSQLLFYKEVAQRAKLMSNIQLRFYIITFFFVGGISGGVLYKYAGFYVLLVPAAVLVLGLIYDQLKLNMLRLKRKLGTHL
jgi:uncharacterized membrane protein YoaK (UPF0700 family)